MRICVELGALDILRYYRWASTPHGDGGLDFMRNHSAIIFLTDHTRSSRLPLLSFLAFSHTRVLMINSESFGGINRSLFEIYMLDRSRCSEMNLFISSFVGAFSE